MNQAITVEPRVYGWVVRSTLFDNEMFFRSGGKRRGRRPQSWRKMASVSDTVTIDIFLRDGSLGGHYVWAGPGWRTL